ncbi:MAG: hybrid sensor histidine kinase/response regulator [Anaerolineae bacterium]|nr:hybrid sensor histidine kinase/response regulator [Anaerolineae bacterium]
MKIETKPKILVVDNKIDTRDFIKKILEKNHYEVLISSSGEDALTILECSDQIALILLNVMTPGLDGFEFMSILKHSPKMKQAKVIVLTAVGEEQIIVKASEAGVADYLCKPFTKWELLARVKNQVMLRQTKNELEYCNRKNIKLHQKARQEIIECKRITSKLEEKREILTHQVVELTADLKVANKELAQTARLKDGFLASMSHELRTPLNAILGISEGMLEEIGGPLTDKQRKSLISIEESGRQLLSLVNNILDVSRIEAGKMYLDIGPVFVESVCQSSLRLIKQPAQKKQIKVFSHVDNIANIVQADNRRLKQILSNMLSNAVKFTPENGKIGLEIVGDPEKRMIHFTVWDTGIGISLEQLSQLFKPFVQLDSRLSREYSGTGLGLVLTQRIAEMHGGSVSVESKVGQGSRFTVSLPWHEE